MNAPSAVILSTYSPLWPAVFELERDRLVETFDHAVEVEHVGSTAVPGLGAKPIIDILVGAPALEIIERRIEAMVARGYRYVPEFEKAFPDRRYFTNYDAQPGSFHVHAVLLDSPYWKSHLAFRDALRADGKLAGDYWKLKKRLAARFPNDRTAYADGKAEFIQAALRRGKS